MIEIDSVRRRAEQAGQGHVFRFHDELTDDARAALAAEVDALDFELIAELARLLKQPPQVAAERRFEPPDLFTLERRDSAEARRAHERGEDLLASGRVAYVLVAGGQASRLGYDGPKGAYPIGPVSRAPLFAFHADRLRAAARRYGARTPWAIMTSPANDAVTRSFFEENAWFGLPREDVSFFRQDALPALDDDGRILLAAPDRLFLAPNGHGGSLWGLARSGTLKRFAELGVTQLSYFQVDNPLARPADPLFLGLHDAAGAGMSSKVVKKRDAGEKVGVIGRVDGALGCIEYSDLSEALREKREPGGELAFRAGNIAVHLLERAFVERLTAERLELPWHLARKKVKVLDDAGRTIETYGTKFETFVFDALGRSPASVTLEVDRALQFSPVKNAEGEDSPATCRRDLCRLWSRWVAEAGRALPPPDAGGLHPVEISPLVAETREQFLARKDLVPDVRPNGHLYR